MGLFGQMSGFSSGGMGYAEQEAQRVASQRLGRSSGAQAGVARVARTVGRSSGARSSMQPMGRTGKLFTGFMKAFKSMGPMG
jgi:hypothetical protein